MKFFSLHTVTLCFRYADFKGEGEGRGFDGMWAGAVGL